MIKYKIISTTHQEVCCLTFQEKLLPDDTRNLWLDCKTGALDSHTWDYFGKACKHLNEGNASRSIQYCKKLLKVLQTKANRYRIVFQITATTYYDYQDFRNAAINYAEARKIGPDSEELIHGHATAIYKYGKVLYKRGRTLEAIEHAQQAKKMFEESFSPEDAIAQRWLQVINRHLNHWQKKTSYHSSSSHDNPNKKRKNICSTFNNSWKIT